MSEMISIIVPIYKVEDYLERCIKSIVKQTYKNIEIILIDDGSPDNSPIICDIWAKKDNRIKVIHKTNGGLSDARNCGIRAARGKYILFVDSDDYIESCACEKLISYANNVDIVVGEATVYEVTKVIHRVHTNLQENYIYSGGEYSKMAIKAGEWFAEACYNMYKRTFLLDNNLYFTVGILHEDMEFLPRLFLAAKTVKYLHYEFYKYIIREGSICTTKSKKHLNDLLKTYSVWKRLNDNIIDKDIKKYYSAALSKYFISTCRQYKFKSNVFPEGINRKYLLKNTLNFKEFIKTIAFILFRSLYVNL